MIKIIGGSAPFLFLVYKYRTDRKDKQQLQQIKELKEEKLAHKFNQNLLSNLLKLKLYSNLDAIKNRIFKHTRVNRFIIFVAINGKTEPGRVFALYGDKHSNHEIEKEFKSVEIDDTYRSMLKKFEQRGSLLIDVFRMPKGMLRNIYFMEECSYSYGKFVKRYSLDENNDALVYLSMVTDHPDVYPTTELTFLDIEVSSNIKPLIDQVIK